MEIIRIFFLAMYKSYDVFLSYATVDNTVLAEPYDKQDGWVMCFKVALEKALDRELGRTGSAKWFLDAAELRTGNCLESEIFEALDCTKIFLALVSPGYMNEQSWCKLERERFMGGPASTPDKRSRVFAVLLDEEMRSAWGAAGFAGVLDFPFYDKNEAEGECMRLGEGKITQQFIQRIAKLAKDIAKRIKEMDHANVPPLPIFRGTVALAAVSGEIEDQRSEIAQFLKKEGWRVLPERNPSHSNPAQCLAETNAVCTDALAFIQLLSQFPWRPTEYDRLQLQAAMGRKMPVYRYRKNDFDVQEIPDERHRQWLQAHDVAARSLPAIMNELKGILRNLLPSGHPTAGGFDNAFITVSSSSGECASIAKPLTDRLARDSVFSFISDDPAQSFEQCLLEEHGLVTVFGNEPYKPRVEQVLLRWRQALIRHLRKFRSPPPLAIYFSEPPRDDKWYAINVTLPEVIPIWSSDEESGIKQFVEKVRNYMKHQNRAPAPIAS